MNLTKTNWPAGWNPSTDPVNGDPNGLPRMDNLCIDSQGVLSIIEGMVELGTSFSDYVSDIFSRVINGTTWFWIGLNASGTSVFRIGGVFSDPDGIPTVPGAPVNMAVTGAGANSDRACFGDCLGQVLAFAGMMRTKDDVSTSKTLPLGLLTPVGPGSVTQQNQSVLTISGAVTVQEGTDNGSFSGVIQLLVDTTTLQGIGIISTGILDTTSVNGSVSTDISSDLIQFQYQAAFGQNQGINTLQIQFLLDANPTDPTTYLNYYVYNVNTQSLESTLLIGYAPTTITLKRGDFTRVGSDSTKSWSTVTGVRVTSQLTEAEDWTVTNVQVVGGSTGQLNGVYNYIVVNVYNNGKYLAKSPPSAQIPLAGSNLVGVNVINGSVVITMPAQEAQVNELWFFRQAATDVGLTDTGSSANSSNLDQYYFCGKAVNGATSFHDTLSDNDIIEINIRLNPFLQTLRTDDSVNGLQDTIYCVEGLYFERMIYMGRSFVYLSDNLDPDAIDSRYTLKPSGDGNEKNLWIKKIANGSMILATTKDLYEVTGTFASLPDGTLDASLIPIGDAFPPLSQDCCSTQGGIFYVASDGLRFTTGQHSQQISTQLNYLFQGQARHGVPPILVASSNQARYAITQGHGRIYFTCPLQDGTIRLFVYDLVKQIFYLRYTDPITLHTTPNGVVIAGYETSMNPMITSGALYRLENSVNGVIFNEGTGFQGYPITFWTVFDANGQPRNRKDTFTLKLILDTGGDQVSIYLQKDGIADQFGNIEWVFLKNVSATGLTTIYIPLNPANITLGFRYALKIVDVNLISYFKLYEYTIEYDPRPEQLDYMRIQPSNLGTICRKRIVNYAFVIDTLSNNITFTPLIDNSNSGVVPASSVVNTPAKQTYIHYFTQEQIGTDINGILSGGVFEFYGLNLEEIISEKLPVPVKFLVIPANNYGEPNRKRHTSYKFQCNTRNSPVIFTPILDGVSHSPYTFTTSTKRIVEYFFPQSDGDVIGIDIGGTLQSADNSTPFEFYGVITPQQIEVLPPRLEYYRIPNTNFGVASAKRLRTIPIIIDTYGLPVVFTPIVDGVAQAQTTTLTSSGKTTLYHFFDNDVFGTDFGGILSDGAGPFEFYELGTPEDVETLPVPKQYDQLGPVRFDKIGKIFTIRIRLIPGIGLNQIPVNLYGDTNPTFTTYQGTVLFNTILQVLSGTDNVYEIQLPKSINTCMCRIVLGPCGIAFYRYDVQIRVSTSGMESDAEWQTIR